MVNDYNHHMGGVDTADQLRSYNSTQLRARRNWMPLFFWLLDIVLVNCFILAKLMNLVEKQVDFRKKLVWELISMAKEEEIAIPTQPSTRKIKITKKFTVDNLPAIRLKPGNHLPVHNTQRKTYVWCSLKSSNEGRKKSRDESQFSCKLCNVYLCLNKNCNCFNDFHTLDSL